MNKVKSSQYKEKCAAERCSLTAALEELKPVSRKEGGSCRAVLGFDRSQTGGSQGIQARKDAAPGKCS